LERSSYITIRESRKFRCGPNRIWKIRVTYRIGWKRWCMCHHYKTWTNESSTKLQIPQISHPVYI